MYNKKLFKMEVDEYTLQEIIEKGVFGEKFLGSKKGITQKYFIKKFENKLGFAKVAKKYIEAGISILKDIDHPNIIKLYEKKDKENEFYVIEEYCNGGDLKKFLDYYLKEKKSPFSEEIVQHLMRQIIDAVKYLHDKKIIHRDLKPEHILLNYADDKSRENKDIMKATIKIIGFDIATHLKEGELAHSIAGTYKYMSPYILNCSISPSKEKNIAYDEKEDIWSLGITCYELLTGKFPYNVKNKDDLVIKVNKGDYYLPLTLSKEAVSFLNCMLQFNSEKRLTAAQLSEHNFLKKNVSEFKRIDVNELKDVEIIAQPSLIISTKDNKHIWDNFGNGSEK